MNSSTILRYRGCFLLLALSPAFVTGCGNDTIKLDDSEKISNIFLNLSDILNCGNSDIFLEGAMPAQDAERQRFRTSSFGPIGAPRIKGDTAMVTVAVFFEGDKKGEVEWTFVKNGEQWRIKSAPMP